MEYAIVDIETTGSFAAGNGITEIAIYIHNGQEVLFRYETLVNPQMHIPLHITALTGIDNAMVQDAPTFVEVAEQIYELLKNRIFVAHNVNFDYSFVKHHLAACGYQWQVPKLCTVRLSRKLLPGHSSYSLGRLCQQLNIRITHRHRAGGDAAATSILFSMLLEKDEGTIQNMLKKAAKEQVLPPHLPKEDFDALPAVVGVYYFKNQKGKVIYVGKAKNIKNRVASHFSGQNPNLQRQHFLRDIYAIDFTVCGTELMALLLEATEIKRLWPENNRALKRFEPKYGIYLYEDQRGYLRLAINTHQKFQQTLHSFGNLSDAYNFLQRLINEYQLCPKLCAIQKIKGPCLHYQQDHTCLGACAGEEEPEKYNARLQTALEDLESNLPSFFLIDRGRTSEEQSCIWIEKGKFSGMGYVSHDSDIKHPDDIKTSLTPYPANDYMVHLIMTYAERNPAKVKNLNGVLSELRE